MATLGNAAISALRGAGLTDIAPATAVTPATAAALLALIGITCRLGRGLTESQRESAKRHPSGLLTTADRAAPRI